MLNQEGTSQIQIEALEIQPTKDGSSTLIDRGTGITYRSVYGAATESSYVFVEGTRVFSRSGPWRILEFGLGGGTSFLSTIKHYRNEGLSAPLDYHAIERAPILESLAQTLHQSAHPQDVTLLCDALKQGRGNTKQQIICRHPALNITLTLWIGDFRDAQLPKKSFDAVYHDPFDPQVNPDGWSDTWFSIARHAMKDHAILTTYSAASAIRRTMAKAGLYIGTQPGSGGKREMTGASPSAQCLTGYKLLPAHKQPASGK